MRLKRTRKGDESMKSRILRCCTILGLGLVATVASADDGGNLEGVWFAVVTPVNCTTHAPIPGVMPFRGLYLFGHDGSLTNEAAFLGATVARSSGVGAWQHTQAQSYASAFWF